MKKIVLFILLMAFVLSNVPFTNLGNGHVAAAAEYVEMYDEEYVYGDFVFDVYHTPSWEYYVRIKGYRGNASHIIIPDKIYGIEVVTVSALACQNGAEKNVKELTLGANVRNISVFPNLPELEAIHVSKKNYFFKEKAGVLFEQDSSGNLTALVRYPRKKKGSSYKIPDSVEKVVGAFEDVEYLKKLTIGKNVKTIRYLGQNSKIEQVNFPKNGKLKQIGEGGFQHMSRMEKIQIPKGVTYLGPQAFAYCERLTSVHLPSTLERIERYAFCECYSLKDITIPKRVYYISGTAFMNCQINLRTSPYLKEISEEQEYTGYCYRIYVKASYKKKTKFYSINEIQDIKTVKKTIHIKKGKKVKLSIKVRIGSRWMTLKTPVAVFQSSNKKVATVDNKGIVKARKKGTAQITAKLYREVSAFPYDEIPMNKTTIKVKR